MALDQKFFKKSTAATGLADQEQGLVLHLDANDVDSYDGDGTVWYDIAGHEVNIPLIDKADNLQLHLNASDTTSYNGSGTTWTDISGNDRHGTITDPVFESDLAGGLDFNSATGTSGDKVAVAHNAAFNQQNNMSFEVWLKRDGTTENNIFHKGGAAGNSYFFTYNPSWGYYFYSYALGGGTYTGTSGLNTGVYEHVVITIDGSGNRKIYVNGNLSANNNVHSATGTGTLTDTGPLTIGGYYTYAAHGGFDGRISVVRIYNTVLTAAEVGQNFRAGNNLSYSSVITSKHEATQGTLYSSNLQINLDANSYSGSGNWLDGANDYDATISAATYVNDNNSDYFDFAGNTNNPVSVSYNSILNAAARTWEFWVWFDTDAMNFFGGVWGSANNTKTVLFRMKDSNNAIRAQVYDGAGTSVEPTTANNVVNTSEWNHIVFTSDNSNNSFKIYVNGVEKYSDTLSIDMNTSSTENFIIGAGGGYSSNRLDGRVAQFRYYNAVLTSAQINTNYNATKALYQNPTLKLHFDASDIDTTANTWTDKVSSIVLTKSGNSSYDAELGDYLELEGGYYGNDSAAVQIKDSLADFTVEYFGQHVFGGQNAILGMNQGSLIGYILGYTSSNYFLSYNYKSGTNQGSQGLEATVSSTGMTSNKWHHVVLVYDQSTNVKLYVDGILKATSTLGAGGTGWTTTAGLRIGDSQTYSSSYSSDGKLGYLKIYQGKLSDAHVVQNYLATKSQFPNGINFTGSNISWNANGYFSFNGSNAKFGTSGAPSALINATGFTVSAWLWRTNGVTGSNTIVGQSHDNGNSGQNWILTVHGSGTVYFHIYGTDDYAGVNNVVSYETWTHLAGVVEADGVKRIYKNGVVQLSTASGKSADTVSYNTFVGNLGNINWHDGRIGAVKYYKKPLTADELLADYNSTKGTYGL